MALVLTATLMLAGCFADSSPQQEPATVVKTITELQGKTVQLKKGETLGVDTEGEQAQLYDAMILDATIASYQPSAEGSQIRITAEGPGTTDVMLGDQDETVDSVSFTLTVSE